MFLRLILFIFTVIFSFNTLARSAALTCLAKEETAFHKTKELGPEYQLNQKIVNLLAERNGIVMRSDVIGSICSSQVKFPARLLLKYLLTEKEKVFLGNPKDAHEMVRACYDYLMEYVAAIEVKTGKAGCLNQLIPELKTFKRKVQYLRGDVADEKIFSSSQMYELLKKLERVSDSNQKCS